MGLRCLLGHDFTQPEIEREREEEGGEVVVTVREVKTCQRCGERQIVSKNTEITSVEQLAGEADRAAAAADEPATDPGAASDATSSAADDPDEGFLANASRVGGDDDADDRTPVAGQEETVPADRDGTVAADRDGATADDDGTAAATDEDDGAVVIDDEATGVDDEPHSAGPQSEPGAGADAGTEPATGTEADSGDADADADDGVILDDEPTPDLAGAETTLQDDPAALEDDPAAFEDRTTGAGEEQDEADDGVILDEEATAHETDRDRGEWPDHDRGESDGVEHRPWPEQSADDEGYDAELSDGEAEVSFGGGLTPRRTESTPTNDEDGEMIESSTSTGSDASPGGTGEGATAEAGAGHPSSGEGSGENRERDAGTGITRADSSALSTSMEETDTEFYCPECGLTRSSGQSSMRAGDICPDCRKGYIDERPQ